MFRRHFLKMFAAVLGAGAVGLRPGGRTGPPQPDTFKWSEQEDPTSWGRTYWVNPTTWPDGTFAGDDRNDGLSPSGAFRSLQRAVAAAHDGDRVVIASRTKLSIIEARGIVGSNG